MSETVVIIGAGQAGGQAAVQLRALKYEGRIVLIGDEDYVPYERPPLSKQYLAGEVDANRIFIKQPNYYKDHDIEVRLGKRATEIDREKKEVLLDGGERVAYDKLILATGSQVRKLNIEGSDLDHIFYLRTIYDVERIKERFREGATLVIVGGGYIGLEVAAVARKFDLNVIVLEALDRVMARVVAPDLSDYFEKLHRDHGVDIRTDTGVTAFEADDGTVKRVVCGDGSKVDADLVVVGIGIMPLTELAEKAGLSVDDGIVVNEFTQTDDADIYAIGDCTNHPNSLLDKRLRLESVHNAVSQANTAALHIAGKPKAYAEVPWFWSNQYDIQLQIAGISEPGDEVVLRGDPETHNFSAFYLRDGAVVAINAINNMRDFMPAKQLIAKHKKVDPEVLADTDTAVKDMLD